MPKLRKATAAALKLEPIKDITGEQHAYERPETHEWLLNGTVDEVTKMLGRAMQSGFYAGQAMAGVEIEDCEKNWKKYNKK